MGVRRQSTQIFSLVEGKSLVTSFLRDSTRADSIVFALVVAQGRSGRGLVALRSDSRPLLSEWVGDMLYHRDARNAFISPLAASARQDERTPWIERRPSSPCARAGLRQGVGVLRSLEPVQLSSWGSRSFAHAWPGARFSMECRWNADRGAITTPTCAGPRGLRSSWSYFDEFPPLSSLLTGGPAGFDHQRYLPAFSNDIELREVRGIRTQPRSHSVSPHDHAVAGDPHRMDAEQTGNCRFFR
jgi:hypothetical protein